MQAELHLTFSSPDGTSSREFRWDVRSSSLAERWLRLMIAAIAIPGLDCEQRFAGFEATEAYARNRVEGLNRAIASINAFYGDRYRIPERAHDKMSQEELNVLHHHFELLIGQSWNPSPLFLSAPPDVKISIRRLNDFVHDFEASQRAREAGRAGDRVHRYFQCQFVPYEQQPLTPEDLSTFTFVSRRGDLVTNYCQLGKNWVEVMGDRDQSIFPGNISPLRYYTHAFNGLFYEIDEAEAGRLRKSVQSFILERAKAANVECDPGDVRHALGRAVYASLPEDSELLRFSGSELDAFMFEHPRISHVRVRRGAREWGRPVN